MLEVHRSFKDSNYLGIINIRWNFKGEWNYKDELNCKSDKYDTAVFQSTSVLNDLWTLKGYTDIIYWNSAGLLSIFSFVWSDKWTEELFRYLKRGRYKRLGNFSRVLNLLFCFFFCSFLFYLLSFCWLSFCFSSVCWLSFCFGSVLVVILFPLWLCCFPVLFCLCCFCSFSVGCHSVSFLHFLFFFLCSLSFCLCSIYVLFCWLLFCLFFFCSSFPVLLFLLVVFLFRFCFCSFFFGGHCFCSFFLGSFLLVVILLMFCLCWLLLILFSPSQVYFTLLLVMTVSSPFVCFPITW